MREHLIGGLIILLLWLIISMSYAGLRPQLIDEWQTILFFQLFLLPVFIAGFFWPWWSAWLIGIISGLIVLGLKISPAPFTYPIINSLPMSGWAPVILLLVESLCYGAVIQGKEISLRELKKETIRIMRDLTREREQYQKNEQLLEDLRNENMDISTMLGNLMTNTKLLNQNLSTPEIHKGTIDAIRKLVNPDYCAIYGINPDKTSLIYKDHYGTPTKNQFEKIIPFGEGIIGSAAERRQTAKSGGVYTEADLGTIKISELTVGIPITYLHKIHGVIYVEKEVTKSRNELLILETFASFVGMALYNAQVVEETYEKAIRDGLTKLYNHEQFFQRLREIYAGAKRYLEPLSVILLDVDFFKHYNDTNGHQMGDVVLSEIGNIIMHNIRQSDIASRYGGEEFAIILTKTDIQGALKAAEKLRNAVKDHYFANQESQPSGNLTCSLGVSTLNEKVGSPEELIELADRALYQAKHRGRNCVESMVAV